MHINSSRNLLSAFLESAVERRRLWSRSNNQQSVTVLLSQSSHQLIRHLSLPLPCIEYLLTPCSSVPGPNPNPNLPGPQCFKDIDDADTGDYGFKGMRIGINVVPMIAAPEIKSLFARSDGASVDVVGKAVRLVRASVLRWHGHGTPLPGNVWGSLSTGCLRLHCLTHHRGSRGTRSSA